MTARHNTFFCTFVSNNMNALRIIIVLITASFFVCLPIDSVAQRVPLRSTRTGGFTPSNTNQNRLRPPIDTSQTKTGADKTFEEGEKGEARLLETYLFNDTIKRQRIFTWQHNRYLNTLHLLPIDTLINDRFRDYPFLQNDVGATYLGTVGSAVMLHNYFERQSHNSFYYLTPHLEYAITPENIKFYNTKTAYTRFEYSGTLFANSKFEEGNVDIFVSANMLPQWNWSIHYKHLGTRGLLDKEATDNNLFTISTSYSGKRYNAHAGFIYNGWENQHNGGMANDGAILDTTINVRTIDITLSDAVTNINNYSFFLTHSYAVPLNFFRNDSTLTDDGTVVFFGHSAEYTTATRNYTDNIPLNDSIGRAYYQNKFYINPTATRDSMRYMLLDNKLFLSLQPWASDAIVSKLTGGIGFSYISNYGFRGDSYLSPTKNETQANLYTYASASGVFSRYFNWNALARYDLTGYTQNDFSLDGNVGISLYPLKGGVHLSGNFLFQTKRPDYFFNNTYGNHFVWQNDFDKTIETRIQAKLSIPDWDLEAGFNYSLLSQAVYFDTLAMPRQLNSELNIMSAYLQKNFKAWLFHFDHRVLFQLSSDKDIMPLPALSANLTYYLQAELVKNVLTAQIGVDMYYNTAYYAHAYNPATGTFHTQTKREIGNYPYMDAFINMKWKHANIFLKMVNVNEGMLNNDYFSALHYIRPQRVFKFGISWFFF